MLIRPLTAGDRAMIAEMLETCGGFNREEISVALEVFDEGIASGRPDDYALFGAAEQGRLQGYICVGLVPLTESSWDMYWLCIHPAARRLGVGRALVAHAEGHVMRHGGRRLAAQTSGRPDYAPVRAFYAALGYEVMGRIPDYFRDGDDGVFYCRVLVPTAPRRPPPGALSRPRPGA
jgi:ribosomal protein S18 acetylase RimI-like enzyme